MLRKIGIVALWWLVGWICPAAAPQTKKCKGNERLVGDCFKVHGRMTMGNGGPAIRIWRIGTDRKLGVWDDDEEPNVAWLPSRISKVLDEDHQIFADFEVCPLTKEKADELQIVCVESASKTVIRDVRNKNESKGRL
ncbi:MAG: hypothetical protein WBP79_16200 [Candidatus Acidiferrales bacterium]